MQAARIRNRPLKQIIGHADFQKRIYQLGMSARRPQESRFNIKFDLADSNLLLLSEVQSGRIQSFSAGLKETLERVEGALPPIIDIHNHPVTSYDGNFNFDFFRQPI